MAQRELSILADARVILNDTSDSPRWSTERLMGFLDDAQNTMCKDIPLITKSYTLNTVAGQAEYSLPYGTVKLLRASSEGTPLNLVSYEDIEDIDPGWEDNTSSSFSAIIVSALSQQKIRPYPLISESKPIKMRYHSRPVGLGWDSTTEDCVEELTIEDMWDSGLKQYVVAQAFLDYGDESSNSRANTALGLFEANFTRALKLSKKSFAKRVVTTKYQAKVASSLNRGDRYGSGSCRFGY